MSRKHSNNVRETPDGGIFVEGTNHADKPVRIYYTYTKDSRPKCSVCGTTLGNPDLIENRDCDNFREFVWRCFNCGGTTVHHSDEPTPMFRRRIKAYQERIIRGEITRLVDNTEGKAND